MRRVQDQANGGTTMPGRWLCSALAGNENISLERNGMKGGGMEEGGKVTPKWLPSGILIPDLRV